MPPPPKVLPGFYFDPDKNRYFPIKGPIPGSKRPSSSSTPSSSHDPLCDDPPESSKEHHIHKACGRNQVKALVLLHVRELHGRLLIYNKSRYSFKHEYQKLQASHPMVWKYSCTSSIADSALEQLCGIIQTTRGLERADILTVGSIKGYLNLYAVGNIEQYSTYGLESMPMRVWPPIMNDKAGCYSAPRSIWDSIGALTSFSSSISHIQRIGKHSPDPADDVSLFQNALVTTLGSGLSGGTVNILNLSEPLDFRSDAPGLHRRTSRLASCDCTIWTADCNHNGTQAVIGTNMGAALIDLETGGLSWVYRTKSDIFSQQYDQLGNVVLCGLRNGSIIAVDVRQKQATLSARSTATMPSVNQTSHVPPFRHDKRSTRQKFELKRNLNYPDAVSMSSAVCSLRALQSDDQYFLGSSMDGSIKLFDRRLLDRGAVQSYEGHVNSHTHLQLGVNPSETLVMSGGEDCYVRIWSIKTGELIFGANVANSVLKTVCWPGSGRASYEIHSSTSRHNDEMPYELTQSWGAWLGSQEGLFYMHGT